MSEKILLVDDDANILKAYGQNLRKSFEVETASGGEEALALVRGNGPYAVVVSDMRMPGMGGIDLLKAVRDVNPDTVRVMLTGFAEINSAMEAVNEGNIFRFLSKPCPIGALANTLTDALKQYRLVTAEKELLERTLKGSIRMLTDILSIVNPAAFSRSSRVRRYATALAREVRYPEPWEIELAAMLSQIGCITLSQDLLDKVYARRPLNADEEELYAKHPAYAYKLLSGIPRLQVIASIVAGQNKAFAHYRPGDGLSESERTALGAQIIRTVVEYDQGIMGGMSGPKIIDGMREDAINFNPYLLDALVQIDEENEQDLTKNVSVSQIGTNMVADENIVARNGVLLVPKGQEFSNATVQLLKTFKDGIGVNEPFRVVLKG